MVKLKHIKLYARRMKHLSFNELKFKARKKAKMRVTSAFNLHKNKVKIFGIGANKTGTTSLKTAMIGLDILVGNQRKAENLIDSWAKRDFDKLIKYCDSAQFFQDVPFSLPYTYVVLDHEFPGSKFILTVRDDSEQWYNSLTKFHAKKWGVEGEIPDKVQLQKAYYLYEGRPWDCNRWQYNTPEDDPYQKEALVDFYEQHIKNVMEYFRHRPNDLLILNVAEKGAYKKLCDFLGLKTNRKDFPWRNKT